MRVTILSREFPPAIGGIGDHTDRLARALHDRGHHVTVVTSSGDAPARDYDVRAAVARWDAGGIDAIAAAVRDSAPDVVVWQYNPFSFGRRGVPAGAGRLARALASVAPLALWIHELWFPWGRAGLRGLVWAVAQRLQVRPALRAAQHLIVTTAARAAALRAHDTKTTLIPVGTNIEPAGVSARPDLGIPDGAFVVAHLGTTGPGKDMVPVLEAVRAMRAEGRDVRLVLAGRTGTDLPTPGLDGAVVRTGTVEDPAALSPVLAAADVYVHPDHAGPSAGRRTSIVAALAHGLPVVSYDGPDRAPDLTDGHNVVLVRSTAEAVAAALRGLADDPARARAIGEAAVATYERSYSWHRIGDSVVSLLEGMR